MARLLPATLMSVYYFGMPAVMVILVCLVTSLLTEAGMQWLLKKPITLSDGSAFLTGLLLAMNLPSNVPLYIPFVGSFVAIMIAKHLFGGLGFNIFNPALDRPRLCPGQFRKDHDHLRRAGSHVHGS